MRILVDTNVILDFYLNRDKFGQIASDFFTNARIAKYELCISPMTLRDIGYIATKELHSAQTGKEIQLLTYRFMHKIINLEADDAINALYSDVKDYEDALLIEGAERELINLIVTNNYKDFKDCKIPVWTPEDFNKAFTKKFQ